jgi:hypothetical protein
MFSGSGNFGMEKDRALLIFKILSLRGGRISPGCVRKKPYLRNKMERTLAWK